jgi:type IV pilus assembly protein PilB
MGLNQVNVNTKSGLTFASSLRSFLRQDPDVIMVGEVRDQETAGICMRAALTGHLVISTLHTNDSLQVINRLTDMGIEPFLLAPALRLLQAQRLGRRLCAACKQPRTIPDDVAVKFGFERGITIHRPGGGDCKVCRGIGYKGRVGLYEVVQITDKLREMICDKASVKDVRKQARSEGMNFLSDSARRKVVEGLTSIEEVSEYLVEE